MIFDAHCDTMVKVSSPKDFLKGGGSCQIDLPGLRAAGVTNLVTAVCVEPYPDRLESLWEHGLRNYRESVGLSGSTRLHFALEGCLPLHLGYHLPVKPLVASLTWNGDNPYGSGIGGAGGLTPEGFSLARRLHRSGTRLDVSHLNDTSRRDLLSLGLPVCATHCNARKICGSPRNLPDADLKEIAGSGGVIGITLVPAFLGDEGTAVSVSDVVRHILHVADVAGIGSVGLGSDFDGIAMLPGGISGVRDLPVILHELEKAGLSREETGKVASGNWERFFFRNGGHP